jgi:hypothetical protein
MINWSKVTTTLMGVLIVGSVGFFLDFQTVKGRVTLIEKEIKKDNKQDKLERRILCKLITKIDPVNAPNECLALGGSD